MPLQNASREQLLTLNGGSRPPRRILACIHPSYTTQRHSCPDFIPLRLLSVPLSGLSTIAMEHHHKRNVSCAEGIRVASERYITIDRTFSVGRQPNDFDGVSLDVLVMYSLLMFSGSLSTSNLCYRTLCQYYPTVNPLQSPSPLRELKPMVLSIRANEVH